MEAKQIRKENRMRKEKLRVEKLFSEIPIEMRAKYGMRIDYSDNNLSISKPSYINIDNPQISHDDDCVLSIKNKKVVVTLWKTVLNMHVTVL